MNKLRQAEKYCIILCCVAITSADSILIHDHIQFPVRCKNLL